jgi:hypothetical protein
MEASVKEDPMVRAVNLAFGIIRILDRSNKGNITYISTIKVMRLFRDYKKRNGSSVSPKVLRGVYEILACVANKTGGFTLRNPHTWVVALPHNVISTMSDRDLNILLLNCLVEVIKRDGDKP